MKITIISPFSFGYMEALVEELHTYPGVKINFIRLEEMEFRYSGILHRLQNFFLKNFAGKNLKKDYQENFILQKFQKNGFSDVVLVIRPDKLKKETLAILRQNTHRMITYCFDSISNFPEKEEVLPFFDEVYSYEKADVEKYKLKFVTNFIPCDRYVPRKKSKELFNISSFDERFALLEQVARSLKRIDYPYRIIVRKEGGLSSDVVEVVENYIPQSRTRKMIDEAGVLVDIQKTRQLGLSFRVFEALGAGKKLITNNEDVKNYDFYRPENILVIDSNKPAIPKDFFEKEYREIPEEILVRYRREAWIKTVFGIEKA